MPEPAESSSRRPLRSRESPFFQGLAARLAKAGATPNGISALSMVGGAVAGLAFAATHWHWSATWVSQILYVVAAIGIQFRLICNLLDGMVAVEHERRSKTGDLWNEAPDRFSDVAIIVGAGFAAGGCPTLGFVGAIFAVTTAYVRAFGASVGAGQIFTGVGAKPQRMAILTVAAMIAGVSGWTTVIFVGLIFVCLAAAVTVVQRLILIRRHLLATR